MRNGRALVLLVAAVTLTTGCASHNTPSIAAAPERPPRLPEDLIVLLADADGSVGRAVVTNTLGSTDLQTAGGLTKVSSAQPPSPSESLTDGDVQAMFGEALSSLPAASERFTLLFVFESEDLTAESRALVAAIVASVQRHRPAEVTIVGHADAAGASRTNFQLGLRRAQKIRDLLIAATVDASTIEVSSRGETDPAVQTANQPFERRNRRVDVTVR